MIKRQLLCLAIAFCLLYPGKVSAARVFEDVAEGSPFYGPISWAVEEGITNGTTLTTFSPNSKCTIKHILTFLWRKFGKMQTERYDIKPEFDYVREWAYREGLIESDNLDFFSLPCTRSQAVMFMWQIQDRPNANLDTLSQFNDVPAARQDAEAIAWAAEVGITNGNNGSFNPDADCTRGQIATFIYRAFQ